MFEFIDKARMFKDQEKGQCDLGLVICRREIKKVITEVRLHRA